MMSSVFRYWKRPWHKWAVLIECVSQLTALWLNIQEYQNLSYVHEMIFSESEWRRVAAQEMMQCSINALLAASFFGVLIIGHFAHSKRSAKFTEGIFCIALGLIWGAVGLLLPIRYSTRDTVFWLAVILLAVGGGVSTLWRNVFQYKKTMKKS